MASVPKSQFDDLQKRHVNMRKSREREQRRASKFEAQRDELLSALIDVRDNVKEDSPEMWMRVDKIIAKVKA